MGTPINFWPENTRNELYCDHLRVNFKVIIDNWIQNSPIYIQISVILVLGTRYSLVPDTREILVGYRVDTRLPTRQIPRRVATHPIPTRVFFPRVQTPAHKINSQLARSKIASASKSVEELKLFFHRAEVSIRAKY